MNENALVVKLVERMKQEMGDLMTPDEMRPLVARAVEEAFFTPREFKNGYHTERKPPLFVELVEKHVRDAVHAEVTREFAEHPERIAACIEGVLKQGVLKLIADAIEQKMQQPFWDLAQKLRDRGVSI